MSPKVFNRYLKKLRSLRPKFQKFLKENGVTASVRETGIPPGDLHNRFLGQHFDKQYQEPQNENEDVHPNQTQPIRKQPHILGGLMYASPTFLESFFTSGVYPGIVLEEISRYDDNSSSTVKTFLVSTAGVVGRLEEKMAGPNVKPAFNDGGLAYPPAELLACRTRVNTLINVKVLDLQLDRLPEAVTAFPHPNSSKEVSIIMQLTSHSSENDHSRTNTHPPGSLLYNAPEDSRQQIHSKNIYNHNITHIYTKNRELNRLDYPANKSHEEEGGTGSGNTDTLMDRLWTVSGSTTPLRKVGLNLKNMGWSRPKKSNWQWSNPDEDDGDTG